MLSYLCGDMLCTHCGIAVMLSPLTNHPALVAKSRGIEVGGDRGQGRGGPS